LYPQVKKILHQDMLKTYSINDGFIEIENHYIKKIGLMKDFNIESLNTSQNIIDLRCQEILPCWSDSHTHFVFSGTREKELKEKIQGKTYQEIKNNGGGINYTAQCIEKSSEEELFEITKNRIYQAIKNGTGSIEIKSGYGLESAQEIKILRVIKALKKAMPIPIKSTFLAAHTIPPRFQQNAQDYVDYVIQKTFPIVIHENLADFVDVFCEQGFFNALETEKIILKALENNLKVRLHVNQFNNIGGIQLAIKHQVSSIDHLENLPQPEIDLIGQEFAGYCTALPAVSFYLGLPYSPAKKLIEHDAALCLATDFNPGSSPTNNMNFIFSLACLQMKLLPLQALIAATLHPAASLNLDHQVGSIAENKLANLIVLKPNYSLDHIPYFFNENLIDKVFINGEIF
ncbi:MAG: imidazolonepropionase, partial [Sediminibacterium sp.]|nr:imidazolonepropionase [Sediminibacterium sp.]